jgi:hypothetical protein
MEEYEHLGEVKTYNIDLHKRYKEITDSRRIMVDEKDADRNTWSNGHVHWSLGERPKGRAGKGASNHCAHGKTVSTEVTLDWRPFDYSTTDSFENGKKTFSETFRFEPLPDGGTRVTDVMQMHMPLPRFIRRALAKMVIIGQHHYDEGMRKAAQLAGEEFSKAKSG